jgi:hypothetical protein
MPFPKKKCATGKLVALLAAAVLVLGGLTAATVLTHGFGLWAEKKTPYRRYAEAYEKLNAAKSMEANVYTDTALTFAGQTLHQSQTLDFSLVYTAENDADMAGVLELKDDFADSHFEGKLYYDDGYAYYDLVSGETASQYKTAMAAGEMLETFGTKQDIRESDVVSASAEPEGKDGTWLTFLVRGSTLEDTLLGDTGLEAESVHMNDAEYKFFIAKDGTLRRSQYSATGTVAANGGVITIVISGSYEIHSMDQVQSIAFPGEIYDYPEN